MSFYLVESSESSSLSAVGGVCPVCEVKYSQGELSKLGVGCRFHVGRHFLAFCKACRCILVLRFRYVKCGKDFDVLVSIVSSVPEDVEGA